MIVLIRKTFSVFILLLLSVHASILFGQNTDDGLVGIGQWRMHLPYNKAVSVTEGNGKVYCASRYGLFSYDKNDGTLERYSRISGLSDFEIASISYNSTAGVLVIAYENSNIDLLYDNHTIINLSDIQRSNIVGNKSINNIFFVNQFAYLSCGFGIIVIDLTRKEIKDTYYIGPNGTAINVNALTADGTSFFAATDQGIYRALVNDPNIFNYTAWNKDTSIPDINGKFTSIVFFSNKIFAVEADYSGDQDTIWVHENSTWSGDPTGHRDFDMKVITYQSHFVVKINYTVEAYDINLQHVFSINSQVYPYMQPRDGFVSEDNSFWVADYNNGLIRRSEFGEYANLTPNGPRSSSVFAMQCLDDDLWVASGSLAGTTGTGSNKGCYLFNQGNWNTFDVTNDPGYDTLGYHDVVCIAVDPKNSKHAFAGTWGSGLLEYNDHGVSNVYSAHNSTLQIISLASGNFQPVQVGGVAFDSDDNLWVTNTLNSTPLSVFKKSDSTWKAFVLPSQFSNTFIYSIVVDDFNQKWMSSRGTGIGVFNENDINNPNDNSFKLLTNIAGLGNLPSLSVFCMAKDKDGAIWLGSDQGVAVIYNPGNVFTNENYDAQQILIQQDGHTQYLLQTETVLAMAVDGANRKWFGTVSGGVFLMSADGTQELLHFTVDNSPLLSNYITSIAINDKTGEVFFGTEKGIVSYRGDATAGGEACEGYLVFPNPVKHEYNGPIAIKGLVNNADVKITDITGTLVFHTKANGGEAIWNGTNFKGDRAHTGVYLVYASNEDGTATCVSKMLFIH